MRKLVALILSICMFLSFSYPNNGSVFAEKDPDMLEYATLIAPTQEEQIEEDISAVLSEALGNDYLVDVQVFYESKEAIEEGIYNSKETEYFGFLLSEVDAYFEGTPYVFCIDDDGETAVKEFVPYDDTWDKVLTNVAIGTGVILVCVTVSSLTVTAAPAVHLVFAAAKDYAINFGIKGALTMGIRSAVLKYAESGDIKESLKSAALGASEGYKWGAIGGAITGATAKTVNLAGLRRATHMSMNDVAKIQMYSNFSDATIKNIHSMDEFNVYQKANLVEYEIGGKKLLLPADADWDFKDPATGLTNRELIANGHNPVDNNGISYEWHHVGQKTNSPLALLTKAQHHSDGNDLILHHKTQSSVVHVGTDSAWQSEKRTVLSLLSLLLNTIR